MTADSAAAAEATGDADVDAALALLVGADGRPLPEQADVFERVHRALHDALDASA